MSFANRIRALTYLITAVPLGTLGAVVILVGWTLTPLLAITPAVVPVLIGFRAAIGWVAGVEASLAHSLLGVRVSPRTRTRSRRGFWGQALDIVADGEFAKQQVFSLFRFAFGGLLAIAEVSLIGAAVAAIAMPVYYSSSHPDVNGWHVDTLWKALVYVPAGVVVLALALYLLRPLAASSQWLARRLLDSPDGAITRSSDQAGRTPSVMSTSLPEATRLARRQALAIHTVVYVAVNALLIVIWAATTRGYFWPAWPLIALFLPLSIHAWVQAVDEQPALIRRGQTRAFAIHEGVFASFALFYVFLWLASGGGYFWPLWPIIGLALILLGHRILIAVRQRQGELEERIGVLEDTRAEAVDQQEDELRRIERNLHDGAQARLVALGMSLGMAEQKLKADPEAALALIEDAQRGAREALEELRDLARGIHPPVLTDRGLAAALATLTDRNPLDVELDVDLLERPPAVVETAAYFVVAEALANATKHSGATRVEITVHRRDGSLEVEVIDDGHGGANPSGTGLKGLARRVRALDGTLEITSPAGGPTVLRAELPCES